MANLQTPLVAIEANPDTATYIGTLERAVATLVIRDAKFRALLELLTDQTWDDVAVDRMDNDQLVTVATANLALRLNISVADATELVAQRWATHNESTALEPVDSTPAPVVQLSAKDLFEQWKARREATAAAVTPAEGDVVQPS